MKSKVILFCVLLFCSKIVDSIPHSDDHVRQRVNPIPNWQVNQNAPNTQYFDTDFTKTRNVNIQPEKTQDFYQNQGRRHNYDSNVYNRSPASSPSGEDRSVSYDFPADGLGLDSYPSRVESYPSRTSQVGFDNQQYRNQNWRPQNQYTKPAPSAVLIPDDERPLVTTVQEPYRGPVQYLRPKYMPPRKRRFYQPGRTYLTREQVQYPLTGERKYVANSAPRFGSSGPVPYENYGEDQVAASEIKARPTGGRRYAQSIVPQSGIIYNEAPAVTAADTFTDQSENIEFTENYRSRSVLSNSAPITNQDFRSPLISEPDNNSDSIPSFAHINTKKDAPVIISKTLSEKPLARKYANNYRSDSGWSNNVGDDPYNGASVVNEPVEVKSGKYEANHGPIEPVPINTYSGAPSAPSGTVLINSGNNKREERNVAHHGSSSLTPTNTNPKHTLYPTISSEGITEYNLSSFVAKPEIQDILARTNKRYVVVHSNGTVEFLDTIDLGSPQNSKLRLVHHKRKNIEGSDSDGVLTHQLPENLPNNIATAPLSVGKYLLPTNNQPADDKKPSPLKVDEAKSADENGSNLSPPLKDLPANHSNLKPSPQPEKQPADNNNYKLLPSSSTSNEDQSTQNDNLKPLHQNQPRDDDDSKTLIPHVNQSVGDGYSKPLLQDGNKPAHQKNQSANDDNLKSLTSKEIQAAVDHNSKLDQTKGENNFTPLFPNARQPAQVKKPKNSYVKHPVNDNNSEPWANENQPQDDKPFHPYRRHPAYHYKSKHSHVNQPADNSNSNPSSPDESQPSNDSNSWLSNEDQSGGDTDFTSLLPHKKHPVHRYKQKSRHSNNQSADDNPSTTPKQLKYPENQPGGDKKSKPSLQGENQSASDNNSWPSKEDQSGDETDSTSLLSHKKQPSQLYKPKSRYSHNQPADDNPLTTPKLSTYPKNQPGGDKNSNPSSPNENAPESNDNSKPLPSNKHQLGGETDFTSLLSHKKQPSHLDKPKSRYSHNQAAVGNPSTTPNLSTYPINQPGGDKNSNPSSPNENAPESNDNSKPLPSNKHQSGGETDSTSLLSHKKQPSHLDKPKSRYSHNQPAVGNSSTTPNLSTYPINQPGGDKNSNPSSPNENAPESNDNSKPLPSNEHQSGDETDSTSLPSDKKQPSHHYEPKSIQSHDQLADDNPSTTPKLFTYPKNQPGGDKNSNPSSPNENAPENNDKSKPLPSNEHQSGDETDSTSLPSDKKQPSHHYEPKSIQSHDQLADDNPSTTPKLFTYPKNQPGGHKNSNPSSPNENAPENNDNLKPLPSNEHQSGNKTDSTPSHKKQPSHHYKPKSIQSHDQLADDNPSTTTKLFTYPKNQPGGHKNSNPSSPNENAPENNDNSKPLPSNEHQSGDETDSTSLLSDKKQSSHHYEPKSIQSHDQLADDNPSTTPKLFTYPKNQPGGHKNSNPSSPNENAPENKDNSKPLPSNEHQSGDETDSTSLPSDKKQPSHHYEPKSIQSHDQLADENPSTTPKLFTYPKNQPGGHNNSRTSSPNENAPENNDNSKPLPSNEHQSGYETDSTSLPSDKKQPSHHYEPKSIQSHDQPADDKPSTSPKLFTYPKNQPGGDKNSNRSSPNENAPENNDNSKPLPSNEHQSGDKTNSTSLPSDKKQPSHHYEPKSIQSHDQPADNNPSTTPKLFAYLKNQPGGHENSNPSSPNENAPENNDNSKPLPSNEHQSGYETDSTSLPSDKKQPSHHYEPKSIQSHDQPADDKPSTSPKLFTYPKNQPGGDKNSNRSSPNENAPENNDNSKPLPSNEHQSGDKTNSTSLPSDKKQPSHHYEPKSIQSHDQPADNNPSTTPKLFAYLKNQPGGHENSNPSSPNENAPENNDNSKPLPSNEHQSGDETDSTSLPSDKKQPSHHYEPKSIQSHDQLADDNPSTTPKLFTYPKNQPGGHKNSNPSSPNENAPENNDNSKPLPSNEHQSGNETDSTPSHKKQPSHHYEPKSIQSHDQPADDNPSTSPKLFTYPKNQPEGDENSNPSSPNENAPENNDNSKPLPSNEHQSGYETDSTSLPSDKKQPSHHYEPKSIQSHDQPADDKPSTSPKLFTYPKNQPGGDKNSNRSSPNENAPENNDNSKPLPSNEHQSGDKTNSTSLPSDKKQPSHHYEPKSIQSHDQPADNNPSTTPKLFAYLKNQPGGHENSNPSSPNENAPENNDDSKPLPSNEHQSGDETDSTSLPSDKKQPSHHYEPKSIQSHDQLADDNPSTTPKLFTYPKNQPGGHKNSNPSSPNENAPENNDNSKPLPSNEHQSGNETDSTPSHKKQPSHHYEPKSIQSHDQPADDNPSTSPKLFTYPKNQPEGDENSNPSSPNENAPENKDNSKPLPSNDHQSGYETDSTSLPSDKKLPSHHHYEPKSIQSHDQLADDNPSTSPKLFTYPKNQPGGDKNSNPSSPNENAPENNDNSKPLPSNEHQSGDKTNSTSLSSDKKQPSHHYEPKSIQSHDQPADNNPSTTPKLFTYPKNQPGDHKNSNPSSPNENAPENNDNSKPLPSNEHQSSDETDSTPSHKKQPSHHYKPKSIQSHDQLADDNPSTTPKLLTYPKNQPGSDKMLNPSSPNENAPENNDNSKPLPLNEHQSGDETDSTSLPSHKKQSSQDYKPKSRHSHDQPTSDNNSYLSSTSLLNYPENQPGDYDDSNPSSPSEDQTGDDNTSEPLNENQSGDGNDSKSLRKNKRQPANDDEEQPKDNNDSEPLPAYATHSANNTKSKPSHDAQTGNDNNSNPSSPDQNQPKENKQSKPLHPNENQPTEYLKTRKPTSADASKTDDQSNSTKVSLTEPNHTTSSKPQVIKTHKRKHIHRTSTTSSPVVSTTPCPDDTSEDQIITLSPIEQTTDNVSDVPPPVATKTTTRRPVKTPGKSDNDANNKQDDEQDDIAQTYSTTTVSPSTSTSPTDNISDDKTIGTKENEITQVKEKIDVDQDNNREKDTQTAVSNSSELFDTNTDVPAESDDYSSVKASPSVQNDVDTGDASGDNSLELEQSETDVTITVSSSKANDSEDEMININIEVSESTDNADSSSTDKSSVVSIDTNDGSDDDSKTPKPEDCKKDNNNDGRGKNVEIDMSNLKGEPTMWIRTTNQDFVDKLTAKNDTEFDLIYFFHIDNHPAIEREKTTTIYCNGTVVTEIIEITYANKDDLTPTIVKTTTIMDLKDYKADEV